MTETLLTLSPVADRLQYSSPRSVHRVIGTLGVDDARRNRCHCAVLLGQSAIQEFPGIVATEAARACHSL